MRPLCMMRNFFPSPSTMTSLLKLVISLLGSLPLGLRRSLGRILGRIFSMVPTKERTIATMQLELMLGPGSRRLIPGVYMNVAQTFMESIALQAIIRQADKYVSCDREKVREFLARRKPIVALTAHTANWDLLGAYMVAQGAPLSTIGQVAHNRAFQEVLAEIRQSYGIKTIWRDDKASVKQIVTALKNNEVVSALIDQDTTVRSKAVKFFSYPARTPSGIVELGKKYECVFVAVFILRTDNERFEIVLDEIDNTLSVEQILSSYSEHLERAIRRQPQQWVWFHKRWRGTDDENRLSSKEYMAFLKAELAKRA